MEEIVFSIGNHGVTGMENLKKLVDLFERKHGIHVRLDIIPNLPFKMVQPGGGGFVSQRAGRF